MLEVMELRKRYGSAEALAGVSFTIGEGELFGLLGPNGAGKSTLLTILSALTPATSGRATLFGQPIDPDNIRVRPLIGIVPQDLAIYPELTARENLSFFGSLYGVEGARLQDRVNAVLGDINLSDRADDRAGTFSGGMKRRLNLGCALIHEPRILYLDEPTVGVDPQSRNAIFESVRKLNAQGSTIIYTSHYMEEVQGLCQRVAILDHGRVIACDSLSNLLRTIGGQVRFCADLPGELRQQLASLGDLTTEGEWHILKTPDVASSTLQTLALLQAAKVRITAFESREPNLEQLFLQLTGHALRD